MTTTNHNYIEQAPNGDWLVLRQGTQDRLLSIRKTRKDAEQAKYILDGGGSVPLQ